VKLYKFLSEEKKEFTLSKQILKSGTSVGALIRESEHGESKMDFIHKLAIALKEANETEYWLNILKDVGHIDDRMFNSINHGYEPQGKPWTQIPLQSSGVLYPPPSAGLFNYQF